MSLKIGALFAGYGGLDLAVEEVFGATTAWVSEFDKGPSTILAARFPHAPNHGDVTQIDWAAVEPVDIITGGSPCQDLSHAGKRAGMKTGTRSGLWASMCDAVETIRPRFVVWENVRGALSAEATAGDVESCEFCMDDRGGPSLRALGRVLGDLAELGYDAAWCGLRAADVGAPHGRFRVFVLAWDATRPTGLDGRPAAADTDDHRRGQQLTSGQPSEHPGPASPAPHALLRTPTAQLSVNGGSQHPDKRKAGGHGPTLADEVEHLLPTPRATDGTKGGPNQRGSSGDLMLPSAVQLMPTPRATRGGSGTETMYGLGAERSDDHRRQGQVLLPTPTTEPTTGNGHARNLGREALLPTPTASDVGASGGAVGSSNVTLTDATVRGDARGIDFGAYGPAIARWEPIIGRPSPAPTEPTGKSGAQRLSPRFVEWLMGLPDGWVTDTDTTRNEQLKALGNGVVPQQAAAAIRHMLHTINLSEEAAA